MGFSDMPWWPILLALALVVSACFILTALVYDLCRRRQRTRR